MTEEDAESGRRGDAARRACLLFDAKGLKKATSVVENKKDLPRLNQEALDMRYPRVFFKKRNFWVLGIISH
jgi:hypothetical protein